MKTTRRSGWTTVLLAGLLNALLASSASAETVTYTYDALGRVSTATYGNTGETVTYSYDAAGNRTEVVKAGAPAG